MLLAHRPFERWPLNMPVQKINSLQARFGSFGYDTGPTAGLVGVLHNYARNIDALCECRILTNEAGEFTSRELYVKMPSLQGGMNTALAVNLLKALDPIFLLCQYRQGRVYSVAPISFHQDMLGFLRTWKLSEAKGNKNRLDNIGLTVSMLKAVTGFVLDLPGDQEAFVAWLDRDYQKRKEAKGYE